MVRACRASGLFVTRHKSQTPKSAQMWPFKTWLGADGFGQLVQVIGCTDVIVAVKGRPSDGRDAVNRPETPRAEEFVDPEW